MGPIRVLIADDDRLFGRALHDLLAEEASIDVVGQARGVQEAVELAGLGRPQVALIDVRMPGGGGAEATRAILARDPSVRVIALSASERRAEVLEMLSAGATGYLVKGATLDEILGAIQRAHRGESPLSPTVARGVIDTALGHSGESDLHRTLRARREQLLAGEHMAVRFQPIVELATEEVVGYEALTRFELEPARPPDEWFAAASQLGFGTELELAAVRNVVIAAGDSARRTLDGRHLGINASPQTVCDARFADALAAVDRERLVVEVTEHATIADYEQFRSRFSELAGTGVTLAVDDAGSGYASLRHILQLEPRAIKLDLVLIRDIDRHRPKRVLAATLLEFAHQTGATVVAEGIETAAELGTLRDLGIRYGQGFLFGRPAPIRDDGQTDQRIPG